MKAAFDSFVVVAVLGLAASASAQEVQRPTRYLIDVPPRPVPDVVVIEPAPPAPPVVVVQRPAYVNPVVIHPVHAYEDDRDGPYDTGGIVVAGAGLGGAMFLGGDAPRAAAVYRLHLGLAVDHTEFALSADLIPAIEGEVTRSLSVWGAGFSYRFLDDAVIHPVAGASLDALVLGNEATTRVVLGASARLALELAFPLDDGALAMGIDLVEHHALTGREQARDIADTLTLGAYAHFHF